MAERIIRIIIDSSGAVTGSNRIANALGKITRASKDTHAGVSRTTKALDDTKTAHRSIDGTTRALDRNTASMRAMATAANRTAGIIGRLHSAFISLTGGIIAALAINRVIFAMRDFVTVQKEFGAAMSTVGAITKASTVDMESMEMVARQLGATTVFSSTQAAEGMLFLGRAGYDANKIMETIPVTLDLATAAALDLGRAADITTNIMSAFNIQASETAEIADTLAVIANAANTDVSQMGDAMKYVGPVTHSLGIAMRDTAAYIGVLSNAGLQGTMAGTGLRRALSELISPSKKTKEVIRELGLTLEEVNPAANKISTVFQRFKMAGLEAGQALEIFGDRGGPAALVLTEMSDQLETMEGLVQNVSGEAKRMAEVMRDNLAGDLKILTSVFQEAILQTGDKGLTGAFRGLIKTSTGLLQVWTDTIDPLDENINRYVLMAKAVEGLVAALAAFVAIKVGAYFAVLAASTVKSISAYYAQRNAIISLNALMARQASSQWALSKAVEAGRISNEFYSVSIDKVNAALARSASLQKAVTAPIAVPSLLGGFAGTLGLVGGALAVGGIIAYRKEIMRLIDPLERLKKQIDDQKTAMLKVSRETDHLVERYKELANIESRTDTQQNELKVSTERLVQLHPELANVVDGSTKSFERLNVALRESKVEDQVKELTLSLQEAEATLDRLVKNRRFQNIQQAISDPFASLVDGSDEIEQSKTQIAEYRTEIEKLTNDLEALRATGKSVGELAEIFHNVFQIPSMLSLTAGISVLSFGRAKPELGDPEEFKKQAEDILEIKMSLEDQILAIGLEGAEQQIQSEKARTKRLLYENEKRWDDIIENDALSQKEQIAIIDQLRGARELIKKRELFSIEAITKKAGDKLKEVTEENEKRLTTIGLDEGELRRQQVENEYNDRFDILRKAGNQAIEAARGNSDQIKQIIKEAANAAVAIEEYRIGKITDLAKEEREKLKDIRLETMEDIPKGLDEGDSRRRQIENEYQERLRKANEFGKNALAIVKGFAEEEKKVQQELADTITAIEEAKVNKLTGLWDIEAKGRRKLLRELKIETAGYMNQFGESSYLLDIGEIEAWREEISKNLDENASDYQEMMSQIDRLYFLKIKEARRNDLENSRDWQAGLIRANQAIVDATENQARRIEDIWLDVYSGLNDNTARFLLGMEQSWDSYFQNIQLKIAQNALDQLIFSPIAQSMASSGSNARFEQGNKSGGFGNFFGGLLGGLFGGGGVKTFDSGGINERSGLFVSKVPEVHIPLERFKELGITKEEVTNNETTIFNKMGKDDFNKLFGDLRERKSIVNNVKVPSFDSGGVSTKPGLFYSGVPEVHIPIVQLEKSQKSNQQKNENQQTIYIDNRTTIQAKDYNSFKATEDQVMNQIALKQKRSQQRNRI